MRFSLGLLHRLQSQGFFVRLVRRALTCTKDAARPNALLRSKVKQEVDSQLRSFVTFIKQNDSVKRPPVVPSVFTHFPVLKINRQILKNFNPKIIIKSANAKQLIQCM